MTLPVEVEELYVPRLWWDTVSEAVEILINLSNNGTSTGQSRVLALLAVKRTMEVLEGKTEPSEAE